MPSNKTAGAPFWHQQNGGWELYVFFNARGTRSEGAFGVLLKDGSMVAPARTEGEQMDTGLGVMKYYGADAALAWSRKGWLFADVDKIPHSDWLATTA